MSQYLPTHGFEWVSNVSNFSEDFIKTMKYDSNTGYFIECDLSYPEHLHDYHNEFPLCPEHVKVNEEDLSPYQREQASQLNIKSRTEKLICTLRDKKRYVAHYW